MLVQHQYQTDVKEQKPPRMNKVDAICELLGIRRSDLMSGYAHKAN